MSPWLTRFPSLSRETFLRELEGHRVDARELSERLGAELPGASTLPRLRQTVASAAGWSSDDRYVSGPELGQLFDGLKRGFDPHPSGPSTLTLSRAGQPQLAMYRIARAIQASAEPAPAEAPSGRADAVIRALPQSLVAAGRTSVPLILREAERAGLSRDETAYVLATARHESLMGATMVELASGRDYEGRADLGNVRPGDGVRFKGRGFVQITGRTNYEDWSRRLGVDLVANPARAAEPEIAARVLVQGMQLGTFTGWSLSDFYGGGRRDDVGARRIVNGTDRATEIAAYARTFRAALA